MLKITYTEVVPAQTVQTPFGPTTIPAYTGATKEIDIEDTTITAIIAALNPATAPATKLTPAQLATEYSKNDLLQAALLSTT